MHPYLVLKIIDDIFQLLAMLGLWLKFLLPRVWFLLRINQHPLQISDLEIETRLIMVIEMTGVQFGAKSYVISNFESQVWFQTKIERHEVQLPLYFSYFEIAEFIQCQYFIVRVAGLHRILYPKQKRCDIEQKGNMNYAVRTDVIYRKKNSMTRE